MLAPLVLITASGLARECAAVAGVSERLVGYLDDAPRNQGKYIGGHPVLGPVEAVTEHPDAELLVCAGKGATRRALVGRLAALGIPAQRYATLVHPAVEVPVSCTLGPGCILLAGSVLTTDVMLGDHVVCMPGAVLTHDCRVEDYATLCAGVLLGGSVTVGEAAYLGMGCALRERVRIGAGAVVGMGSVVLGDVPEGTVYAGVPARQMPGHT